MTEEGPKGIPFGEDPSPQGPPLGDSEPAALPRQFEPEGHESPNINFKPGPGDPANDAKNEGSAYSTEWNLHGEDDITGPEDPQSQREPISLKDFSAILQEHTDPDDPSLKRIRKKEKRVQNALEKLDRLAGGKDDSQDAGKQ